ncbi:hypothetical protein [Streptosporangium sp. NPDC000396]|uniref:hypothetical protein n=1 Tax=Streptosporangium sp. NPDC000396 TaxID=3366185 RepID=UPI00368DE702
MEDHVELIDAIARTFGLKGCRMALDISRSPPGCVKLSGRIAIRPQTAPGLWPHRPPCSPLTMGALMFDDPGWGSDRETSLRLLRRYLDPGGNTVDTANGYARERGAPTASSPTLPPTPAWSRTVPSAR